MKDILERLAHSSSNEGSSDLYCRCLDAAAEISMLRASLLKIKEVAESHPCFAGYESDRDAINDEGGDIAFVTLDIAWVAESALNRKFRK